MKVAWLSALRTGRLYLQGNFPGTNFGWGPSRHQGRGAARWIMSMKISSDTMGNRTRDPAACSAVPQPTNLLYEPEYIRSLLKTHLEINIIYVRTYALRSTGKLIQLLLKPSTALITLCEIRNSLFSLL